MNGSSTSLKYQFLTDAKKTIKNLFKLWKRQIHKIYNRITRVCILYVCVSGQLNGLACACVFVLTLWEAKLEQIGWCHASGHRPWRKAGTEFPTMHTQPFSCPLILTQHASIAFFQRLIICLGGREVSCQPWAGLIAVSLSLCSESGVNCIDQGLYRSNYSLFECLNQTWISIYLDVDLHLWLCLYPISHIFMQSLPFLFLWLILCMWHIDVIIPLHPASSHSK